MSSPLFSIVIPTYNRPQQLARCLAALVKMTPPPATGDLAFAGGYQIVVVDDGSDVRLDNIVADFETDADVLLIRQENAGPAAARNAGAQQASGQYIAFTDDDCMPATDWLQQFATALDANPDAMVGGRTLNALPANIYSSASQALIDYLYRYYSSATQGIFFASNNIAMARSHFLSIGGFDVSFPLAAAEDRNLCDCWQQAGYPMKYVPAATIAHAHALSLKSFWKQHFGYGRGAFCFHKVRANRTDESIKVEPLKFYTDLLLYPLRKQDKSLTLPSALGISSLFFLSQVATTTGFFWERLTYSSQ
ncbi:MAG: glycosyltransferase [Cyanobacteria bacterium J06643_4]